MSVAIAEELPQMKQVFAVTIVQCDHCQQGFGLKAPHLCETTDEIEKFGHLIHQQSGVICGKPTLMIIYGPVLIDESEFERKKQLRVPNGNGKIF